MKKAKIPRSKNKGALARLRRYFPQVTKIVEASQPLLISVTEEDNRQGRKGDSADCALVRACKRLNLAEHALIGIGNSYLVKGNVATRYKTGQAVAREITSFDRHHDFAAGRDYRLSAISPASTLEATLLAQQERARKVKLSKTAIENERRRSAGRSPEEKRAKPPIAVHHNIHRTARVRKLVAY